MKRGKKLFILCFVIAMMASVSSIVPSLLPVTTVHAASKVKLNNEKIYLKKGKTKTLKLKNAIASKIKWTSYNKKIATVNSSGKITAKKVGWTVIEAEYNGKSYDCNVYVYGDKKENTKYLKKKIKADSEDSDDGVYVDESFGDNAMLFFDSKSDEITLFHHYTDSYDVQFIFSADGTSKNVTIEYNYCKKSDITIGGVYVYIPYETYRATTKMSTYTENTVLEFVNVDTGESASSPKNKEMNERASSSLLAIDVELDEDFIIPFTTKQLGFTAFIDDMFKE